MEHKRRIVAFNRVSADGYFVAPDGNISWVVPDDELDKTGAESLGDFDTILFGRRTYENFAGFWPHAVSDSPTATDPHSPGRLSKELRAMGAWINQATKWVFSRTLKSVTWTGSQLFHELDARAIVALTQEPGKDIILFGSGTIVSKLTELGLIDEYQFVLSPVLLGSGRSLLTGVPKSSRVELLETKTYASGNVMLRYGRAT